MGTFHRSLTMAVHLSLLNADRPVTATIVSQALDATGARSLYTVPYVLKFLVEMDGGVDKLVGLDMVLATGSATPTELGHLLTSRGVKLASAYGQTEAGALMEPVGTGVGDWDWYTPLQQSAPYLEFEKL